MSPDPVYLDISLNKKYQFRFVDGDTSEDFAYLVGGSDLRYAIRAYFDEDTQRAEWALQVRELTAQAEALQDRVGELSSELAECKERNLLLTQSVANLSTLLNAGGERLTKEEWLRSIPPVKGY